ncbi:hypothetical protein [Calothrix sp. PCC 6303]|uniref:hypothetical protein n=1 Tax=Calothrix sp. PCC 6303 TaxID=1170562 RepID=UPI0002A0305A|nr:hypothetical protein [Calothrix sp. PCC 6303]AFZ02210.1 hypothetical protein Cal6303_3270 [Calothrix sp. PCC 6303]
MPMFGGKSGKLSKLWHDELDDAKRKERTNVEFHKVNKIKDDGFIGEFLNLPHKISESSRLYLEGFHR